MLNRLLWFLLLLTAAGPAAAQPRPAMYYSDTTRTGRPMAKDPYVLRFRDRYFMYYSIAPNAQFG